MCVPGNSKASHTRNGGAGNVGSPASDVPGLMLVRERGRAEREAIANLNRFYQLRMPCRDPQEREKDTIAIILLPL